jgi:hypothetical protein
VPNLRNKGKNRIWKKRTLVKKFRMRDACMKEFRNFENKKASSREEAFLFSKPGIILLT